MNFLHQVDSMEYYKNISENGWQLTDYSKDVPESRTLLECKFSGETCDSQVRYEMSVNPCNPRENLVVFRLHHNQLENTASSMFVHYAK